MGRPDRGAPVLSGSIIARRPGLSTGGRADRRAGRAFSAIGRWSGFGPAQVQTCGVVPRPVPGGGSRLSLEKARTQRVAGGCPLPPFFHSPLAARSFCFGVGWRSGRLWGCYGTHVRTLIWKLSFPKFFFSIFSPENASQIGFGIPEEIAVLPYQRQQSQKPASGNERP